MLQQQLASVTLAGLLAMTGGAYVFADGPAQDPDSSEAGLIAELEALLATLKASSQEPQGDGEEGRNYSKEGRAFVEKMTAFPVPEEPGEEYENDTAPSPAGAPADEVGDDAPGPEAGLPAAGPQGDNESAPEEPTPLDDILWSAAGDLDDADEEWSFAVNETASSIRAIIDLDLDESLTAIWSCIQAVLSDGSGQQLTAGGDAGFRLIEDGGERKLLVYEWMATDGEAPDWAAGDWVLTLHSQQGKGVYETTFEVLYA